MGYKNQERIKILSKRTKKSMTYIAGELGMSPQNFSNRLRRNNLSEEEMIKIAEVCGVTYKSIFVFDDGEEI